MKKVVVIASIVLVGSTADAALRLSAKIYAKGEEKAKPLFSFTNDFDKKPTEQVSVSTFTDSDGQVAAVEVTKFDGTGKLQLYTFENKQENYSGKIEVAAGKAHFSFTQDGKTKTNDEEAGADFIVGSMIPEDFQGNWDKLKRGEKLKRRLAVVDRAETIGFEFSKEEEIDLDGKKAVVIKMRPSNFLIAAIVRPLRFYVAADGRDLYQLHGRTLVRRKVGDEFKDFEAMTIYSLGGNSK